MGSTVLLASWSLMRGSYLISCVLDLGRISQWGEGKEEEEGEAAAAAAVV